MDVFRFSTKPLAVERDKCDLISTIAPQTGLTSLNRKEYDSPKGVVTVLQVCMLCESSDNSCISPLKTEKRSQAVELCRMHPEACSATSPS